MPKPLTKRRKTGELYVRPAGISAAIDVALTQDLGTIVARAAIRAWSDPAVLQNEVLMHLIRDALRREDERAMNHLVSILLGRCRNMLLKKVPDSVPRAADIRAETLGCLSERIAEDAAAGQTRLDIYECAFARALSALLYTVLRQFNALNRESSIEDDHREDEDDAPKHQLRADKDRDPEQITIAKQMWAGIERLPKAQRDAFVHHHVYGYEIESVDPKKTTVASLCGVTGRTVRNLLQRATNALRAQEMESP